MNTTNLQKETLRDMLIREDYYRRQIRKVSDEYDENFRRFNELKEKLKKNKTLSNFDFLTCILLGTVEVLLMCMGIRDTYVFFVLLIPFICIKIRDLNKAKDEEIQLKSEVSTIEPILDMQFSEIKKHCDSWEDLVLDILDFLREE